jgi:DNA-binding LytR/AlgR family response regulator
MRFADAMAELDGLPGLQVHRSWWVARAAVAGAAKSGRRAELALTNGLSVPISRAAMPEARAAGYLGVRA